MTRFRGYLLRAVTSLSVLTLVAFSIVHAQFAEDVLRFSMFNVPVGARSSGMGNVSIGLADDFSALFTNPAGLASLRSFEFSVGLTNSSYGNDVGFYGVTTGTSNRVTNLNNLGLVYPIPTSRGSLTFAFGFGRVANFTTAASFDGFNPSSSIVESMTPADVDLWAMTDNDRSDFLSNNIPYQLYLADTLNGWLYPNVTDSVQQHGTVREGGGLNNWSLGGAVDIAKNLSLGLTFNIVSGSYTYDRVYTESDARNVYHYDPPFDFDWFRFESSINSDLSGYNVVFGLMYRKQGRYKIGFTVRTPTYYEISETFSDKGTSHFDTSLPQIPQFPEIRLPGETKYNIKTPVVLSGGASIQLGDQLVLAGDAEYTDWTQMEFTNDNPDLVEENRVIRDIFRATTNLRGGAEFTLWDLGLKLRGGVVYNPSPYEGDPKDFDQLYYTAGVGVAVEENVMLNASYAFGKWKTFRDNYYLPGLPAPSRTDESVNTNTVNVTLSYRF